MTKCRHKERKTLGGVWIEYLWCPVCGAVGERDRRDNPDPKCSWTLPKRSETKTR